MAVLVYAETQGSKIKKAALESVFYASKVIQQSDVSLDAFDSAVHTDVIAQVAEQVGADTIIVAHTSTGKSLVGRLAARMSAGSVSGVVSLPELNDGFTVDKTVFSGKAIAKCKISSANRVLSLSGNSFKPEVIGSDVTVDSVTDSSTSRS